MSTGDFIERWHQAVDSRDVNSLTEMLDENITFRSPAFFKAYKGRGPIGFLLAQISEIIPDFHYVETFSNDDGGVALHFAGTLAKDGQKLHVEGVDVLKLNAAGLVEEFAVMIRPLSALQALANQMIRQFAGRG